MVNGVFHGRKIRSSGLSGVEFGNIVVQKEVDRLLLRMCCPHLKRRIKVLDVKQRIEIQNFVEG